MAWRVAGWSEELGVTELEATNLCEAGAVSENSGILSLLVAN